MLSTAKGHFNGSHIVMDEEMGLTAGQQVLITVLDIVKPQAKGKDIDLSRYMGRGEKMFTTDAGEYIKELRSNDRL